MKDQTQTVISVMVFFLTLALVMYVFNRDNKDVDSTSVQTEYSIHEMADGKCYIVVIEDGEPNVLGTLRTYVAYLEDRDTCLSDYRLSNYELSIKELGLAEYYALNSYEEAKKNLDKFIQLQEDQKIVKVHTIEKSSL